MLSQKNRISKTDFPTPKRQGFRVFSPYFSLTFYKNEGNFRVSVVVSKKTAKTAVLRNFLRRRVYHVVGFLLKQTKQPGLLVVYPKKEAENVPFSVLKSEIEGAFRKAGVI